MRISFAGRPTGRRLLLPGGVLSAVLLVGGLAWASWTGAGSGATAAATATLNPPASVQASGGGAGTVTLSWTASATSPTAIAPSGYYVTRVRDSTGSTAAACGTSATSLATAAQCSDTAVADGTYHYLVTAVGHTWTATSASSNSITVSNIRPAVTAMAAAGQADPTNTTPISFTATFDAPVTGFTNSGVLLGGTAAGATATVSGSGETYTITVSGMTGSGTVTASVAANAAQDAHGAGNTASNTASVTYDVTAPVTGSPSLIAAATSGANPVYVNAEAVTFTVAASDTDSGVKSVSYYYCPGATASCTPAAGTLIGSTTTATGGYPIVLSVSSGMVNGTYHAVALVADNAGNTTTSAPTAFAVDTVAPTLSRPTVNGHS
jgi:hypothetical protein